MKSTFGLLALAAAAKLVNAHATVYAVWINDVDQGLGNSADGYIRSPPNNSPITDVTSTDMTCNVNGKNAVAKTLSVKAGDKVTFEWHHNSRDASDDIIASSHLGPVMVYMAPTEKGTAGNGWVKIAEDGYSNGKWAVDTLIANKGKHSITVPDVPAGNYLFRPEIIALHEGNREGGAQLYMECVQVKVTSDGTKTLPEGVSIPGVYTATDPGILFNIYTSFTSYPIPGPAVWDGSSSGSSSGSSTAPATTAAPATSVSTQQAAVETSSTSTYVAPTTFATATKPTTTAAAPAASASNSSSSGSGSTSGSIKIWQQCGGLNYSGATACESGLVCKQWNPYYHQCIKA
ncbi:putative endoglucanase [Aspergillus thermomutatus]|uniref:AA9 family lytic polysaccharide monooxygenase n=1 Tax=Aspergillus thermomutatus TaxID=41047 RepID=A0A397GI61_ASPTH|nr:uncharacterized protein CDV56_103973 [Aspergillus thermomutatus]RHZ49388.1 hypothetical protein CDV56_103973 [Aspergillus thermomutatus]